MQRKRRSRSPDREESDRPARRRKRPSGWDEGPKAAVSSGFSAAPGGPPASAPLAIAAITAIPASVSNQVQDGPNKVFLGNLPKGLQAGEVYELVSVFGPLRAFHLPMDGPMNKGFGFFEYMDAMVTEDALDAMSGLSIGPRKLTVNRSQKGGASNNFNPLSVLGLPANPSSMHMGQMGQPPPPSPRVDHARPAGPTCVLAMENMISPSEDLGDETNYRDLKDDIESEMQKFGEVRKLVIPRVHPSDSAVVVKVLVEFAYSSQAEAAFHHVDGREFGDQVVGASFMNMEEFRSGRYDQAAR